jgi:hypothetical protein
LVREATATRPTTAVVSRLRTAVRYPAQIEGHSSASSVLRRPGGGFVRV